MNRTKKFLVTRQRNAERRLTTIARFQTEARDEMLDMSALIAQVKETITSLENVIAANTGN